jgi:hypothetical protein
VKRRAQADVVARCEALRDEVRGAAAEDVDALWRGEALGTLLWALQLVELLPYDQAFATEEVVAVSTDDAVLRPAVELERERDEARLWHWRARTSLLQAEKPLEPAGRYATVDQLIAATAMRGHERGLLPAPARGDFRAFGKVYRHLSPDQRSEAHSIAVERHHALNWVTGLGDGWDDVPLDT